VWYLSQPPKQQKKSLCMFGIQVGKTPQVSCCAAANTPLTPRGDADMEALLKLKTDSEVESACLKVSKYGLYAENVLKDKSVSFFECNLAST